MWYLFVFAIFLWLGGYFLTARAMLASRELSSGETAKIVAPPKWLYYLCGAPGNKDYPRGTMRVSALRVQVAGIALMIFFLYIYFLENSRIEFLAGLGVVITVSFVLPAYISRKYYVGKAIKEPIIIQKGNSSMPTKITDDISYSIEGNWIDLYSEFGSHGGANLTIDIEELDVLIETLQGIKAYMQSEQSKKAGG